MMKYVENKERLALCGLGRYDQIAIFEAWLDSKVDVFVSDEWKTCGLDIRTLNYYDVYRTKRIPDSINWDHVADTFIAMARDDGSPTPYLYEWKPKKHTHSWGGDNQDAQLNRVVVAANTHTSLIVGNLPWDQSLVIRPGYKPEAEE